jgi:BirA family biotin operon repressor/biotin-[acetyl-CoA-carboxylase] ligase
MCPEPQLPPLFRLHAVRADEDPLPTARALAEAEAEPGTVVWSRRPDRLDCAIILSTEVPYPAAFTAAYVVLVAIGDAIGALAPPGVAVTYGWPDRLEINGALAGGLRMAADPAATPRAVPRWVLAGLTLAVASDPHIDSPGRDKDRTTLHEEGCGEIQVTGLMEAFVRHLLAWINRFEEDGLGPVVAVWRTRCGGSAATMRAHYKSRVVSGQLVGVAADGALDIAVEGRTRRLGLAEALAAPTWSLEPQAAEGVP